MLLEWSDFETEFAREWINNKHNFKFWVFSNFKHQSTENISFLFIAALIFSEEKMRFYAFFLISVSFPLNWPIVKDRKKLTIKFKLFNVKFLIRLILGRREKLCNSASFGSFQKSKKSILYLNPFSKVLHTVIVIVYSIKIWVGTGISQNFWFDFKVIFLIYSKIL